MEGTAVATGVMTAVRHLETRTAAATATGIRAVDTTLAEGEGVEEGTAAAEATMTVDALRAGSMTAAVVATTTVGAALLPLRLLPVSLRLPLLLAPTHLRLASARGRVVGVTSRMRRCRSPSRVVCRRRISRRMQVRTLHCRLPQD